MHSLILSFILVLTFIPAWANDTPDSDITEIVRFGRGTAYTLAWRPDGDVLAVGSSTGVWFFDEDFNELGRLAENTIVDTLEWSPDGERLIAFDNSFQSETCQPVIIWNVSLDLQDVSHDKVFDNCAESIDWSSDGRLIAMGTADRFEIDQNIIIVSSDTYEKLKEYPNIGTYVAFSHDNKFLAINDYYVPQISIKNIATNEIIIDATETMYGNFKWHPNRNWIVTGCQLEKWEFRGSCVWDVSTGNLQFGEELFQISWIPNTESHITWGSSPYGYVNTTILDFGQSPTLWIGTVNELAWHPSGEYFTVVHMNQGVNGYLSHIDVEKRDVTHEERIFSPHVSNILWNPDNTNFLIQSNSAVSAWRWDVNTSENPLIPEFDINTQAGTYSSTTTEIRWKNENTFITMARTIGGGNFAVHHAERNFSTGETENILLHLEGDIGYYTETGSLPYTAWSPDLTQVVYSDWDKPTTFYIAGELFAEEPIAGFTLQADRVRQVEWSPDGSMIATAGELGETDINFFLIEIWDTSTGKALSSFAIEWLQHYDHFIWHPNGTSIAVTSNRTTGGGCAIGIALYDLKLGAFYEYLHTMPEYVWGKYGDDPIFYCPTPQASWSPDGKLIAVSFDDVVRIINIVEEEIIAEITNGKIQPLDWHESGHYLAGGASDGTIYVWDVSALLD